jgi:hypothetical protein
VLPVGATRKLVLCDTSAALSRLTQTTKALLKAGVADRVFAGAAKFPRVTKLAEFGNAANAITAQASVGAATGELTSTAAQASVGAAFIATRNPLGARALSIDASLTRRAADAIAAWGVAAVGNPRRRVWTTELAFAAALEFVSGLVTTQGVLRSARALPVDAYLPKLREATSVGGSAALGSPTLAHTLRGITPTPAAPYALTGEGLAAHTSTPNPPPRA